MQPFVVLCVVLLSGGIIGLAALIYFFKNLNVVAYLLMTILVLALVFTLISNLATSPQQPGVLFVPSSQEQKSVRPGQFVLWVSCSGADEGRPICDPEEQYRWLRSLSVSAPAMLVYADLGSDGFTIYQVVEHPRENIFSRELWALVGPFESETDALKWQDTVLPLPPPHDLYDLFPERIVAYVNHLDAEERVFSSIPESIAGTVIEASYGNSGGGFRLRTDQGKTADFEISVSLLDMPDPEDAGKKWTVQFVRVFYTRAGQRVSALCPETQTNGARITLEQEGKEPETFCAAHVTGTATGPFHANDAAASHGGAADSAKLLRISARDLNQAWADNEIAAKQHYDRKRLEVFGTVDRVREGTGPRDASVDLEGTTLRGVVCSLVETQWELAAQLRKGQSITVPGTCYGNLGDLKGVLLSGCEIV